MILKASALALDTQAEVLLVSVARISMDLVVRIRSNRRVISLLELKGHR